MVAGLGLFLSIYSKGNGLVMAVWVCLFFLMSSLLALFTRSSLKTSLAGLGLLLAVSVAAVALNPVYFTHKAYEMLVVSRELYLGKFSGKMRVIPSQSAEGKALLSETFLSFPLYSLLEHPTNPTLKTKMDHTSLPVAHMRSYWAQVYGNAVFTRFHNWPPTWRRATPGALWLGRVLLVLNLLPLMFFFIGLGRLAILGWHEVSRRRMGENTFFLGTDLGHVAAGVRYAMIYPGPAFSKFIYVAPFLPAAAAAFSSGLQLVRDRLPRLFLVLEMTIYAIAALDIVDVVWLARDLSNFLST